MKKLNKLLLINWHYFWKEIMEFDTINFLTGANAAGKSTIIDAIQPYSWETPAAIFSTRQLMKNQPEH